MNPRRPKKASVPLQPGKDLEALIAELTGLKVTPMPAALEGTALAMRLTDDLVPAPKGQPTPLQRARARRSKRP